MFSKFLIKQIQERSFLFGKVLKPRKSAPPKIKKWINKYHDQIILEIWVCRKPIHGAIKKLLNIVSLGSFDKSLKGLRYEDIFHLYIYVKIGELYFRIEKNEVVSIIKDKPDMNEDCMKISLKNKVILIKEFFEKGEKYQDDFWSYNAKGNNCQNFVVSLLIGSKLISKGSRKYKWIKQDSEAIFKNNPGYLADFGKTITDIAGIFAILRDPF